MQKKLSIKSPEAPSKDTSMLVKHLQEELRNYVSILLFTIRYRILLNTFSQSKYFVETRKQLR